MINKVKVYFSATQTEGLRYITFNYQANEPVGYPRILFGRGGVQQIQLRTEDRENGGLGAVAP